MPWQIRHSTLSNPESVARFETLAYPERVIRSKTDTSVELFYKHYPSTPVSEKFLCIVVKTFKDDNFVITAYYTDSIKGGDLLWEKK